MLCDLLLHSSSGAEGIFESHLCSWTVVSVMYVFLGTAGLSLNYSGLMWIKLSDYLFCCSGVFLLVLREWEESREPCLAYVGSPAKISGTSCGLGDLKKCQETSLINTPRNTHSHPHYTPNCSYTLSFGLNILILYLQELLLSSIPYLPWLSALEHRAEEKSGTLWEQDSKRNA